MTAAAYPTRLILEKKQKPRSMGIRVEREKEGTPDWLTIGQKMPSFQLHITF